MIRIFVSCLKPSLEICRLQINTQMADLMDVPLMFPFPEIQAPWGWWILVFTGLSCLLRPWLTLWSNQVCSPSNSTHSLRTLRVGHQKPSTSGPVWVHIWALCWLFPLFCFLQSQALGVNLRRARHWFTLPPDRTVLYPAPTDWRGKWACGTPVAVSGLSTDTWKHTDLRQKQCIWWSAWIFYWGFYQLGKF